MEIGLGTSSKHPLNVKSLHFGLIFSKVPCKATDFDLPMFHYLAFLYFLGGTCLWNVLPHLLHRAPNLAVLVFHKEKEFFICDRKDSSIIERMIYDNIPKCISSRLKTVSSAHMNSREKVRVLKELLMFPRESRTCQIAFL